MAPVRVVIATEHQVSASKTEVFKDLQIRQLYHWLYDSLRRENCVPGHRLLLVISEAVWQQGYDQGFEDAATDADLQVSRNSSGPFRDGYEQGFIDRKSAKEMEVG
jgi:hypothetical protein